MGLSGSKALATQTLRQATLWKADRSPACRAVMMTLDALNLSVNEVDVDMDTKDQKDPEILVLNNKNNQKQKDSIVCMNNLQKLPILKDRELILCDSHAIGTYLATRYCDSGLLLPKDPAGRSLIEQLMHYDSGVLYPKYRAAAYPILYDDCTHVLPQHVCDIESAYADLERMLVGRTWFSNNPWPMLSDICFCATVSTLNVMVPIDRMRFPRLSGWLQRMSAEMFYVTGNAKGLNEFTRRIGYSDIQPEAENEKPGRPALDSFAETLINNAKLAAGAAVLRFHRKSWSWSTPTVASRTKQKTENLNVQRLLRKGAR